MEVYKRMSMANDMIKSAFKDEVISIIQAEPEYPKETAVKLQEFIKQAVEQQDTD